MIIGIGWKVEYEGREHEVLGYAASVDEDGARLIEIAWSDYSVSPTGYLAVPRKNLKVLDCKLTNVKPPGKYGGTK